MVYAQLFNMIQTILGLYGYVLLATAIMSWIPDLAQTKLGDWLTRLTEPYLKLFRFIPPLQLGGIALDISFIVAVVVYFLAEQGVITILYAVVRGIS